MIETSTPRHAGREAGPAPREAARSLPARVRRRLYRYNFRKSKLSTKNLDRLCRETATHERTLVVHSEDVDYEPWFPNAFTVTKRPDIPADMHVDLYYRDLAGLPSESYPVILCTGLLEHVPDPERLIAEFHRILRPGGRLIISASSAFSIHEAPDDFFHFTQFGFRRLFENWSRVEFVRGSSQPFETVAILLQRINLQCEVFPPIRVLVEGLFRVLPFFDRFIVRQYGTRNHVESSLVDSVLPSNVQALVVK